MNHKGKLQKKKISEKSRTPSKNAHKKRDKNKKTGGEKTKVIQTEEQLVEFKKLCNDPAGKKGGGTGKGET